MTVSSKRGQFDLLANPEEPHASGPPYTKAAAVHQGTAGHRRALDERTRLRSERNRSLAGPHERHAAQTVGTRDLSSTAFGRLDQGVWAASPAETV
jgi:hypothetical protein